MFPREGGDPDWAPAFAGEQERESDVLTNTPPPRRRPGPNWKGRSNDGPHSVSDVSQLGPGLCRGGAMDGEGAYDPPPPGGGGTEGDGGGGPRNSGYRIPPPPSGKRQPPPPGGGGSAAPALTRAWRTTNAAYVKGSPQRDQKGSRCAGRVVTIQIRKTGAVPATVTG